MMKLVTIASLDDLEKLIDSCDKLVVKFEKNDCPACSSLEKVIESSFLTNPDFDDITLVSAHLDVIGRDGFAAFSLRSAPSLLTFYKGDETYRLAGFNQETQARMDYVLRNYFTD